MPVSQPPTSVHAVAARVTAETAIVREINRVRRAHGLRAVRLTRPLTRVARQHSTQMLLHNVLSHSSFSSATFTARLARAGKRRQYGETLAWAPSGSGASGKMVVNLWMHSAPHRAVLMNGALRRVGIGRIYGAMGAQRGFGITADFSS